MSSRFPAVEVGAFDSEAVVGGRGPRRPPNKEGGGQPDTTSRLGRGRARVLVHRNDPPHELVGQHRADAVARASTASSSKNLERAASCASRAHCRVLLLGSGSFVTTENRCSGSSSSFSCSARPVSDALVAAMQPTGHAQRRDLGEVVQRARQIGGSGKPHAHVGHTSHDPPGAVRPRS